jgi:hypothetical protein
MLYNFARSIISLAKNICIIIKSIHAFAVKIVAPDVKKAYFFIISSAFLSF